MISLHKEPKITFTKDSISNLTGKTALVTGGNAGLGYESVKALAANGAHVIMASRNRKKADQARMEILQLDPGASIEILDLDLGSLKSIEEAASKVLANHKSLEILMNNAGLMAMPELKTADGFEMQFGVNHLGHWALTSRLMPLLLKADAARVVTTTSTAHHMSLRINAKNPHMRGKYSPWGAYSHSKLANYYFSLGLHRMFQDAGLSAMSLLAHPGLSHTSLQVNTVEQGGVGASGKFFMEQAAKNGMSALDGALPQIRAAVDPDARSGEFYVPRRVNTGDPISRKFRRPFAESEIAKLWKISEAETGLKLFH